MVVSIGSVCIGIKNGFANTLQKRENISKVNRFNPIFLIMPPPLFLCLRYSLARFLKSDWLNVYRICMALSL